MNSPKCENAIREGWRFYVTGLSKVFFLRSPAARCLIALEALGLALCPCVITSSLAHFI